MRVSMRFTVPAVWALLSATSMAQQSHQCFFPNGDPDVRSSPCNVTAVDNGGESPCCVRNDPCFSDGTCATFDTNIPYRGSCTDEAWQDNSCARNTCMDPTQIGQPSWIIKCFPRNDSSCCLLGDDSCCFGDSFFTYKPGSMIALLDENGNNVMAEGTASPSNSGAKTTATTFVTTTASPQTESGSPNEEDSGPDPAVIGLGVALGVAVLAGGLAVGLLWGKLQSERKARVGGDDSYQQAMMPGHGSAASPSTFSGSNSPMNQQQQPFAQQPFAAYKPHDNSIPPAQHMTSPQQLYAPTPVELHGNPH